MLLHNGCITVINHRQGHLPQIPQTQQMPAHRQCPPAHPPARPPAHPPTWVSVNTRASSALTPRSATLSSAPPRASIRF